ncbi:hypothetical protein RRG08_057631 [Elysia crispata]|uniref:Uncharacterized protein n=1 Tax=Elysia crispata TaxID=231223 RepID=A0AAE1A1B7_9GAST|nr:hypothetical protein RRG08_057631 [Elysia crispata]
MRGEELERVTEEEVGKGDWPGLSSALTSSLRNVTQGLRTVFRVSMASDTGGLAHQPHGQTDKQAGPGRDRWAVISRQTLRPGMIEDSTEDWIIRLTNGYREEAAYGDSLNHNLTVDDDAELRVEVVARSVSGCLVQWDQGDGNRELADSLSTLHSLYLSVSPTETLEDTTIFPSSHVSSSDTLGQLCTYRYAILDCVMFSETLPTGDGPKQSKPIEKLSEPTRDLSVQASRYRSKWKHRDSLRQRNLQETSLCRLAETIPSGNIEIV